MRIILLFFLVFTLAGCARDFQKQAVPSSPVTYKKYQKADQQDSYSRNYGYNDTGSSDSYEKPLKKTYPEPVIQLSPKQIQRALKNAGFYQWPIDGKIGPKTKEAIIKFQKAKGLNADGIVGKRTSAELDKYLSR